MQNNSSIGTSVGEGYMDSSIGSFEKPTPQTLFTITYSSLKKYRDDYSIRGRIGVFILRLLGILTLRIKK